MGTREKMPASVQCYLGVIYVPATHRGKALFFQPQLILESFDRPQANNYKVSIQHYTLNIWTLYMEDGKSYCIFEA